MKNIKTKQILIALMLPLLAAFAQSALAQTSVCPGEEIILTLGGYTGTIQWESSGSAAGPFNPVPGATGDSASIFPDSGMWYRAVVTSGTCDPFYSDTMWIGVWSGPAADAGPDVPVCEGGNAIIGGSPAASGGTPPFTYAWSPAAGLSDPATGNPIATPAVTTAYLLTVTDSNGCSATDSMTVFVQAAPVANAGADTTINCTDTLQLSGSGTGGAMPYIFHWSPSADVSDSAIANPYAVPSSDTDFILTVTDSNGCSGTDTLSVVVAGASTGVDSFAFTGSIDTSWVVPPCSDSITIEVWGAEGGNNNSSNVDPGLGAYQKGTFAIATGTRLKILVGEQPATTDGNGGGGGSFVTLMDNTPLIIAGGGAGSAQTTDSPNKHGQAGTAGGQGAAGGGAGGTNGNGGSAGASGFQSGAGGGLLTDGADGWTANTGGDAFVNGGAGATANGNAHGGFGGGGSGSAFVVGGAGGGYSGGGSGGNSTAGVGGGGGSFNSGSGAVSTAGVNSGHGKVKISW